MNESDNRNSFDRLVAGLSAEDRTAMLNRINQNGPQTTNLLKESNEKKEKHITLKLKLKDESAFYKFILWLRSIFQKNSMEQVYSEDLLAALAKKINHAHAGLINHKIKSLDYIFYERLLSLKEASDFFKPYFSFIEEAPGDFYVFLSSFVAPQLSEKINKEADPFVFPLNRPGAPEMKNELLRNLDDILKNMESSTKANIYCAVTAVNWLRNFVNLPFLHFIAQFTNVSSDVYSCLYKHAANDFEHFASVFANVVPVQNEVLEAIFLFSQRKSLSNNAQEKDIDKAVKDFLNAATTYFNTIQSFVNGVPVEKLGRVINSNYDWEPENMEGAEAWFPIFRTQWRKIIEIRWNEWLKEQKKQSLSDNLKADFKLDSFPVMRTRPWTKMWNNIPFKCELTGGFLSWFCEELYDDIIKNLNRVATEGIFYRSENRNEYSEGMNNLTSSMVMMQELISKLETNGEFGAIFEDFSSNKIHTYQTQKQIDAMMDVTESTIREAIKLFGKGCRTIERIFHGFFDESKDGIHESLQNLNQIGGHDNRQFKDELIEIRKLLKRAIFYISELEPIDAATK